MHSKASNAIRRRKHIWCCCTIVLTASAIVGCQAYQFGAPTLHNCSIRSVYVPMIESDSYRRFLGPRLTEAVIKQIELDTPFVISSPEYADSFLVAKIRSDSKSVRGETINDDPRVIEAGLQVEVTWTDRQGNPLSQRELIRISRDVDFIPEAGQSLTTAQQDIIDKIARNIVGQMEKPW